MSPLTVDGRISPAVNTNTEERGGERLRSTFSSCLMPSTKDEDVEPLAPTKSPEKKMSPSGRSISDIFGKVRKFYVNSENIFISKSHYLASSFYWCLSLTRLTENIVHIQSYFIINGYFSKSQIAPSVEHHFKLYFRLLRIN